MIPPNEGMHVPDQLLIPRIELDSYFNSITGMSTCCSMYINMCVYIYMYIYVYMYTYICIYMYIYMYIYVYIYVYICIYIYKYKM